MNQVAKNILNEVKALQDGLIRKQAVISLINEMYGDEEDECIFTHGNITIDIKRHVVVKDGEKIHLPRKVLQIMNQLLANKGRVLRREQLLRDVWGNDVIVGDRTVDVHIRKIRKVVPDCISTIKGVGYKWVEN